MKFFWGVGEFIKPNRTVKSAVIDFTFGHFQTIRTKIIKQKTMVAQKSTHNHRNSFVVLVEERFILIFIQVTCCSQYYKTTLCYET